VNDLSNLNIKISKESLYQLTKAKLINNIINYKSWALIYYTICSLNIGDLFTKENFKPLSDKATLRILNYLQSWEIIYQKPKYTTEGKLNKYGIKEHELYRDTQILKLCEECMEREHISYVKIETKNEELGVKTLIKNQNEKGTDTL
jgi:hypothetical protein